MSGQECGSYIAELAHPADVAGWRYHARIFMANAIAPDRIFWRIAGSPDSDLFDTGLFGASHATQAKSSDLFKSAEDRNITEYGLRKNPVTGLTEKSADLSGDENDPSGEDVFALMLLHKDETRFARAYHLLWRAHKKPYLLKIASDPAVARAEAMAKAVRRDMHKTKAFVRFRRIVDGHGEEFFIAWFEPDHHSLAAVAPFFTRRFSNMRWSILTPACSAHWDRHQLIIGQGAEQHDAPDHDALENIWRTYYAAIFNPARLKPKAMMAEMPKKYWKNLPEADLIAPLIRGAQTRVSAMINEGTGLSQSGQTNSHYSDP